MAALQPAVDQTCFRQFAPLDQLSPAATEELLTYARIERMPPGRRLFNRGDADGETVFLLSGQLTLLADGAAETLKADTLTARHAIADHQPRRHTVVAHTSASVLCVNSAVLDKLIGQQHAAATPAPVQPTAAVAPMRIHQLTPVPRETAPPSPLVTGLPRVHLLTLKARMERIEIGRGTTLVRQGTPCHYFHLIESGRLRASGRRPHSDSTDILPGDSLGEDLLIANEPHDTTITAAQDSVVLRLPREEFLTLVARHYIRWVSHDDLPKLLQRGDTVLLDIRAATAFQRRRLPGSINFPLPLLGNAAFALDPRKRYVLCSDSVRRNAAAAFLLAGHGVKTRILIGSVKTALHLA